MNFPGRLTPSELAEVADAAMQLGYRNSAAELIDAAYRMLDGKDADDVELTLADLRSRSAATNESTIVSAQRSGRLRLVLGVMPSATPKTAADSRCARLTRRVIDAERHVATLTALVDRLERTRSFTAWKLAEDLLATMTETSFAPDATGRASLRCRLQARWWTRQLGAPGQM